MISRLVREDFFNDHPIAPGDNLECCLWLFEDRSIVVGGPLKLRLNYNLLDRARPFRNISSDFMVARNIVWLQWGCFFSGYIRLELRTVVWVSGFPKHFTGEWGPSSDCHGSNSFVFGSWLSFQIASPLILYRVDLHTMLSLRYRMGQYPSVLTSLDFLRFDAS